MNIIELYENLKGSYKSYLESFVAIKDERIKEKVSDSIKHEELWPKALIQFNPNFEKGIGVKELIAKELPIHSDLEYFFDKLSFKLRLMPSSPTSMVSTRKTAVTSSTQKMSVARAASTRPSEF